MKTILLQHLEIIVRSLNIYLTIAKVHFLLKFIFYLYFFGVYLKLDKYDIILISNLLFNS